MARYESYYAPYSSFSNEEYLPRIMSRISTLLQRCIGEAKIRRFDNSIVIRGRKNEVVIEYKGEMMVATLVRNGKKSEPEVLGWCRPAEADYLFTEISRIA